MKTFNVTIKQNDNVMNFNTEIQSDRINEISGTISNRILKLVAKQKKYKLDFGISFFRKFTIEFTIEGEDKNENNFLLNQLVKTGVTARNTDLFIDFVNEQINEMLTRDFETEISIEELKAILN